MDQQGALQNLLLQFMQGQVDLQNSLQALADAQQGLGAAPPAAPLAVAVGAKKIVAEPGNYDGSPQGFRVWWSKMKLWVLMNQRSGLLTRDSEIMAAVLSRFEGPKAGHWAQAKLDYYMGPGVDYPSWDTLQAEITGFFVPGNNADWARSQLLKLRQGPCQRVDDFLAAFESLRVESGCPDAYARDLLKRAVQRQVLQQVYLLGKDRTTYTELATSVRTVGRAQELFLINIQGGARYYQQGSGSSSYGVTLGAGAPMDIGAAQQQNQQRSKGLQCYNCQGFGHIARECSQPRHPRRGQPQQTRAVQPQPDDEHINAICGMSFSEMRDYFKNLKD